jgi:APA family basic amino acid/polyamine antiporter
MAMAVVVGHVIGSGIYAKPGQIAAEAGAFPLIITAWIVGGALCLLGALCFAELAVMMPRAGGPYVYLREAYGRPVAFLYGWNEFVFGIPASIGALAAIFVGALGNATGWQIGTVEQLLMAVGLIVLLAWVNVLGVLWGGRMQGLTTAIKAGFLAAVAALPLVVSYFGNDSVTVENYTTRIVPLQTTTTGQFAVVLLAVMWAYNGWHGIAPVAEEIRDPAKNIPRALFGGIGLLVLLYVSANFAYHAVLPMDALKASGDHAAEAMVKRLFGPTGGTVMSVGVMLSTFGAINSNMLVGPRISFAMGRDDVFFRGLGRVHVNYRTPAAAIIVQAVMAIGLFVGATLIVKQITSMSETSVFELLTNYVTFAASIFYLLAVCSVFVLRRKHPDWKRPYRTLGYPLTPLLYALFYCWFLWKIYADKPFEANAGLGLIALGAVAYVGYRAWARRHPEHKEASQ